MREIALFVEDYAHRQFVGALLERLAHERGINIRLDSRNATGGHGKVAREFDRYLHDIKRQSDSLPDLIVIATDANCGGLNARAAEFPDDIVSVPLARAIPTRISDAGHCSTAPHSSVWSVKGAKRPTGNATAAGTSIFWLRPSGPLASGPASAAWSLPKTLRARWTQPVRRARISRSNVSSMLSTTFFKAGPGRDRRADRTRHGRGAAGSDGVGGRGRSDPRVGHPVRVAHGAAAESDFDLIVVEVESFGDGRSRHAEEIHFHMASAKFEADADIPVYSRDEADH